MDKNWQGLDFLRGLGIFFLLAMHTAFYYFGSLWGLDLENPPLIITIIGFLLMFAGLFAMISGAVHTIGIWRLHEKNGWAAGRIMRKKLVSAGFVLAVAYLYFTLTGPGLADFSSRTMNNSILVEWIRNGHLAGPNLERLLYVDSLVMIGSNILLVSLCVLAVLKFGRMRPLFLLLLSGAVMALSLLRLPLYPIYLARVAEGRWLPALLLNWLVNKNNPIFPFLAFGLLGAWLGIILEHGLSRRLPFYLGVVLLSGGLLLYFFLPDTMLQRAIDLKWYSIMVTQLGLFLLLILAAVSWLDRGKPSGWLFRFFRRFGVAGLTAFFWESVVAALVWRLLTIVFPGLNLDIAGALLYGILLALAWGLFLSFWEKIHYAGSIEYFYGLIVSRLGGASSKAAKLRSAGSNRTTGKEGESCS